MEELKFVPIETISDRYQITNPHLSAMHREADGIQEFL